MTIQHLRCLVAAGAAALVMGLGGNLYATSYPMPDKFDFGTGPPWSFGQADFKAEFLSSDHDSFKRAVGAATFNHLRQIAAKDRKNQLKIDRKADRVRPWDKPSRVQTTTPASVEPVGTPTRVPDGGATVLLLGGALCGMAALRRNARF